MYIKKPQGERKLSNKTPSLPTTPPSSMWAGELTMALPNVRREAGMNIQQETRPYFNLQAATVETKFLKIRVTSTGDKKKK